MNAHPPGCPTWFPNFFVLGVLFNAGAPRPRKGMTTEPRSRGFLPRPMPQGYSLMRLSIV
jgi:hypothetical protein